MMTNLVNVLTENRGFSKAMINSDNMSKEAVKVWHELLDNLQSACYDIASKRYNESVAENGQAFVDWTPIFSALIPLWNIIELENGRKLRSSQAVAETFINLACTVTNKKSAQLQFVYSQKANATKYLHQLEAINGSSQETIEHIKSEIEVYNAQIEELVAMPDNLYKSFKRQTQSAFYKSAEDFIADMINHVMIQTEAEYQAELEAIRQARRAKTKANRAARNKVAVVVQ